MIRLCQAILLLVQQQTATLEMLQDEEESERISGKKLICTLIGAAIITFGIVALLEFFVHMS
jgi:hypothetical protein